MQIDWQAHENMNFRRSKIKPKTRHFQFSASSNHEIKSREKHFAKFMPVK